MQLYICHLFKFGSWLRCLHSIGVGGGGGGGGGALAPPVGVRCPNFGQNFGQFYFFGRSCVKISGNFIFFRQYCVKILGNFMSFGQVCFVKYFECWIEKPSQSVWRPFFLGGHHNLDKKSGSILVKTFFLEVTSIWEEKKRSICLATFKSFFGQNFGTPPPQIILSSYAHAAQCILLSHDRKAPNFIITVSINEFIS